MKRYGAIGLLLLSAIAVVGQTNELTLSCSGTSKVDEKEIPVTNLGIVINTDKKTVSGFIASVSTIDRIDDSTIYFHGRDTKGILNIYTSVIGIVDQITGSASVLIHAPSYEDAEIIRPVYIPPWTAKLSLTCAPLNDRSKGR